MPVIPITSHTLPFLLNAYCCLSRSFYSRHVVLPVWNHTAGLSFLPPPHTLKSYKLKTEKWLNPTLLSLITKHPCTPPKIKEIAENTFVGNLVNHAGTTSEMNSVIRIPPRRLYAVLKILQLISVLPIHPNVSGQTQDEGFHPKAESNTTKLIPNPQIKLSPYWVLLLTRSVWRSKN